MRVQAVNANSVGDRFRCFLTALRINESATINWKRNPCAADLAHDGACKIVEPLSSLMMTGRGNVLDMGAWHVSTPTYYIKANERCSAKFLYEEMHNDVKTDYLRLKNTHLRPQPHVQQLAISGFHIGFQLTSQNHEKIHSSVFDFLDKVHYPVFVAVDSKTLCERLSTNPNVYTFADNHKFAASRGWIWHIAEILTMGGCNILYITPGSTFGEMGYLFGNYKPIVRSCYDKMDLADTQTLHKPPLMV